MKKIFRRFSMLFVLILLLNDPLLAQPVLPELIDSTTVDDKTYGKNGFKTTLVYKTFIGDDIIIVQYYDSNRPGNLMQETIIKKTGEGNTVTVDNYFTGKLDVNGDKQKLKVKHEEKDAAKNVIETYEKIYDPATGNVIKGTKTDEEKKKYSWDKNKNDWVQVTSALPSQNNSLFVGPGAVLGSNNFSTFGLNLAYTTPITSKLGFTADAGAYFGKTDFVNYRLIQLLGGVNLFPANPGGKVYVSPHVYAGVMNVNSTYKNGNNSTSDNSFLLAGAAGADLYIPVNDKTTIALRGDYNPAFSAEGLKSHVRVGVGVKIGLGDNDKVAGPELCKASSITREFKTNFTVIEEVAKWAEKVGDKIPNVEIKVAIKPTLNVKQGEECCTVDKPPADYTELKGGVEGSLDLNYRVIGIPDIKFGYDFWACKVKADFQLKVTIGSAGKLSLDGVGKFYGGLIIGEKRPDCKACWYFNVKGEGVLKGGISLGGGVYLYYWNWKNKTQPDDKIEAKASAEISCGHSLTGTYGGDDCTKPKPGLHGVYNIGKAKTNLKVNIKLGPISFDPSFEIVLWDGIDFKF